METQKAIELLERNKAGLCHGCVHPAMVGWCKNHCGLPEAFDMAINALTLQTALKEKCLTCEHCERCDSELANNPPELDSDFGDLISRQAVLELTMQYCPDDDGTCSKAGSDIRELLDDIEHLPSAQPKHDISKANFLCPICGAEMEVAVNEWEGENE